MAWMPHVDAKRAADDVTRKVVKHRGRIELAPTDYLEIGEVGLPHLVRSGRLVR